MATKWFVLNNVTKRTPSLTVGLLPRGASLEVTVAEHFVIGTRGSSPTVREGVSSPATLQHIMRDFDDNEFSTCVSDYLANLWNMVTR